MKLLVVILALQQEPGLPATVRFNRDIRPILAENCLRCHGSDARLRKGNLRLDTDEGARAELKPGRFAIVPGDVSRSRLVTRVSSENPAERMPPPDSGKTLTARQIALLKRWIEQGAGWEPHWAYLPAVEPPVPDVPDAGWARTPIDRFVLARLREEGLPPSPEADRAVLARRVTLDLTGLPPTVEELDAFLADASPEAYEKLVDGLLASPRFGEHMARYWLDLARYGDTHGLHLDNYREIWPYREWVIGAFNRNLPFDRFVTEQLAGDLLPEATLEQQVASGFNRCHVSTNEGGSIEEEVYCRNVFDRVETFGQVFMALTFTCARCHDHKYDPFTQKEYYGLFAFFNSLDGQEMDGNRKDPVPTVKVPSPEQAAELARLRGAAGSIEARLDGPDPDLDARQVAWESEMKGRLARRWTRPRIERFRGDSDVALREAADGSVQAGEPSRRYEVGTTVGDQEVRALLLEILPPDPAPPDGPLPFTLSEVELELEADGKTQKIAARSAHVLAVKPDAAVRALIDGKPRTGWSGDARAQPAVVLVPARPIGAGELRVRLVHEGAHARQPVGRFRVSVATDAELLRGVLPVTRGPWHHLGRFETPDGNVAFETEFGPEKGVDLGAEVGGQRWVEAEGPADGKDHATPPGVGAFYAFRTLTSPTPRTINVAVSSDDAIQMWVNGAVVLARNVKRTFRKYDADKLTLELQAGENQILLKLSNYGTSRDYKFSFEIAEEQLQDLWLDVEAALAAPVDQRTDEQRRLLRLRFRQERWPEWAPLRRERAQLRGAETVLLDRIPVTMVFKERAQPKDAFILQRGEYDRKGEKVARGTPAALGPPAAGAPPTRLELARWLLDPAHPLTARVAVNRFWQQCFGVGLVATSEDFGLRGEPPSHPELLDWLAARFVADGWDVKAFLRRLVCSAVYRQESRLRPEQVLRDPQNRLLARGPRFRMDAEIVRDQMLFVSGMLVERIGGPSFKPPQPEGLWEAVGYTGSNTYRFERDTDPRQVFRRSLYIFWKRTSAPPMMTLFDAPSRECSIARRERTNTPMQALMLWNEPQCFEAARHLAQKALREGGASPEERAAWLLRRCTLRAPEPPEVADLASLYRAQRRIFEADPESARKAIAFGDLPPDASIDPTELAAWTMVASTVLNLDEVVSKR
jgi:hypothetical protein